MSRDVKVNRKYKDRLFCLLFGKEEYKENILSLYNALNNTEHKDPREVEITTIDDAVYIGMKNDVSILIDSYLSLWEQQSSYNPNMPLRGFMYFGKMYDSYITKRNLNIYGATLVRIPTPKYIIFYNGLEERAETEELYLSDAFFQESETNKFQWTATMINLNAGSNMELLEKCKPLSDYMFFVSLVRKYQEKMKFEDAVDKAVVECIKKDVLADFLTKHRAEVKDVCITEFNEKAFVDGIHEEGRQEGLKEGKLIQLMELVEAGDISEERAAQKSDMPLEVFRMEMRKMQGARKNGGLSI